MIARHALAKGIYHHGIRRNDFYARCGLTDRDILPVLVAFDSENASPFGTFSVDLFCAARATPPKTANDTAMLIIAAVEVLFMAHSRAAVCKSNSEHVRATCASAVRGFLSNDWCTSLPGRALPVSEVRLALPDFYDVTVRIANVAARLAVLVLWPGMNSAPRFAIVCSTLEYLRRGYS